MPKISSKSIFLTIILAIYLISYMGQHGVDTFNIGDFFINGIIGSIFNIIDAVFATIGVFVVIFFLAKSLFYYAIGNPNKNIMIVDFFIISVVYSMYEAMKEMPDTGSGWHMCYWALAIWVCYTKFRKDIFT